MTESRESDDLPRAGVGRARAWPWLWLLPLAAASLSLWLLFSAWGQKGIAIEVELALGVQLEQLGDVLADVGRPEERADELLLEQGEERTGDGDRLLGHRVDVGHDDLRPLAPEVERLALARYLKKRNQHHDLEAVAAMGFDLDRI